MNPIKAIAKVPGKVANHVHSKVWGAVGGAVITGPLTRIGLWILTDPQFGFQLTIPDNIATDVEMIINWLPVAGAALGGYIIRARGSEAEPEAT